ncbi:hypothetical protein CVV67_22005 [Arthrobacter stackebrandtii]|nr:hypothetical protein CVV67_22005 [Arthrobacter stackebrandtii]
MAFFVTDRAAKLLGIVQLKALPMSLVAPRRGLLLACVTLAGPALAAEPLQLEVYNPGHEAIFPVSSVIVSGEHDAVLVDAQFGKAQAEQLVKRLQAGGKHLTTIYISHGDPDYYFGLDTLTQAFPNAKVLASAATVAHIRRAAPDAGGAGLGRGRPGRPATRPQFCVDPFDQGGGRWRGGVRKHSCVDGRHSIGQVPCRLAWHLGAHRGAGATHGHPRALPGRQPPFTAGRALHGKLHSWV